MSNHSLTPKWKFCCNVGWTRDRVYCLPAYIGWGLVEFNVILSKTRIRSKKKKSKTRISLHVHPINVIGTISSLSVFFLGGFDLCAVATVDSRQTWFNLWLSKPYHMLPTLLIEITSLINVIKIYIVRIKIMNPL